MVGDFPRERKCSERGRNDECCVKGADCIERKLAMNPHLEMKRSVEAWPECSGNCERTITSPRTRHGQRATGEKSEPHIADEVLVERPKQHHPWGKDIESFGKRESKESGYDPECADDTQRPPIHSDTVASERMIMTPSASHEAENSTNLNSTRLKVH